MNIILCGFPGSGKSTLAELLSQKMGWNCFHLDLEVEKFYNHHSNQALSCREIYRRIGEEEFRNIEYEILKNLPDLDFTIFDIGGGTLNKKENIYLLKKLGIFVYLEVKDKEELYKRMISDGIPAYLSPEAPYASFLEIYSQRKSIYESVANYKLESINLEETLEKILKKEIRWLPIP